MPLLCRFGYIAGFIILILAREKLLPKKQKKLTYEVNINYNDFFESDASWSNRSHKNIYSALSGVAAISGSTVAKIINNSNKFILFVLEQVKGNTTNT